MNEIRVIPVQGIPEIKTDDNLAEITFEVLQKNKVNIERNDIFVVTQKIVSKVRVWREIFHNLILKNYCKANPKKL